MRPVDQLKTLPSPKKIIAATDSKQSQTVSPAVYHFWLFCQSHLHDASKGLPCWGQWRNSARLLHADPDSDCSFHCQGVLQRSVSEWQTNDGVNSFSNFLMWQHCEVRSNGIRTFSLSAPQRNICLNNLIVLGIPDHPSQHRTFLCCTTECIPGEYKAISIRIS